MDKAIPEGKSPFATEPIGRLILKFAKVSNWNLPVKDKTLSLSPAKTLFHRLLWLQWVHT